MSKYDWKAIDETEEKMGGTKRIDLDWALEKIKQREHNAAIDAVLEIVTADENQYRIGNKMNPERKDYYIMKDQVIGKIESLRRGVKEASDDSTMLLQ